MYLKNKNQFKWLYLLKWSQKPLKTGRILESHMSRKQN